MKIFVDVEEAAERLEELVELAFRGDDVFVCRGERPIAQLTAFSQEDGLPANEAAADIAGAAHSDKRTQAGGFCSIEKAWTRAADGKAGSNQDMTSAHDDLYDADGLPK
ncbi:hypothetical protein IB238_23150 [Rhizobium sp. ARZ01]|uniref:hypothetical protein n=1 Tax=Rhizobium sp. ARZ01 TaxID=2769313 RepID=UPI00177ED668|nr:hypothetical protein [Rhizobium sp. ARZ01]MBD9375517.1 hypothetical protein [Rhizobium sp. ARZ01]